LKEKLSIIAGIVFIVGFAPYILFIWRTRHQPFGTPGKAEPMKSSWIIWLALDSITLSGMIAKHSVNGQIIGAVMGGWFVVILAMKYGKSGWTRLDVGCIVGAVLGIALWLTFKDPVMAIVTSLSVVFLASIPTFVSAWKNPAVENRTGWTIFWISCVVAMFAIPQWTLEDAAQPITFLAIQCIMMFLLYVRPWLRTAPDMPKRTDEHLS